MLASILYLQPFPESRLYHSMARGGPILPPQHQTR